MTGTAAMSWFWIWPTLVVIGLALLSYLAYRLPRGRGGERPAARRILDDRPARGEIDVAEHRRRAELL
ncbi:SHOCT domain-containing protein [Pseudonocardia abyssalis]|jgi:putative membrane protein|uniref:SHOCT domain-containing protein n=1 Tax=Pseudonocardia abyssalis TaxID=2792008 RepID=A0ABS6UYC3_9PSEU|nr:SHOCT domain-containing protein [Pseudonocardia abyssalis]MBW0119527.1 SHOCT domain-containing protein [Pseudonocardia abyssalis]MBW0137253.1 SHOCT domain-containing protein [Pseudonocardia abyssalis]